MRDPASSDCDSSRGQISIEALVILLGTILVIAVAAGVVITTVSFLQNKGSSTSQDSENQTVAISATGTVDASGERNTVNETELSVMKSPGADEIDLEAGTIEWVGAHGTTTLIYNDSVGANAE